MAAILDPASSMLSFQALLTDAQGDPLPGPTVDIEFNIYDGVGALVEGPILLNTVPVTGGVADALVPVSSSSFDGSERLLGVTVNPPADELLPRISLTSVPYAFRVDRVASEELDDDIELGDASTLGSLTVYRTTANTPSIVLSGATSQISTYGGDGLEQIRLWGSSWGELLLSDGTDNDTTAKLSATFNSGGELILYDGGGDVSVYADGDASGGSLTLYDASVGESIVVSGSDGSITAAGEFSLVESIGGAVVGQFARTGNGALLETYDLGGDPTAILGASGVGGGGYAQLYNSNNAVTVRIDGDADDAGFALLSNSSGTATISLDGDEGDGGASLALSDGTQVTIDLDANEDVGGGGGITLFNGAGARTMFLDADSVNDSLIVLYDASGDMAFQFNSENMSSAGEFSMFARDPGNFLRETVELVASADGQGGGQLILRDGNTDTIRLDGRGGGGGAGVTLSNSAGANTIVFDADAGDDALVRFSDASGQIAIEMHSDDSHSAGRISMYALDTGGTARETVEIIASEGDDDSGQSNNGGQITLSKADGTPSITLDAEHGVDGDARIIVGDAGRIVTPVLEITGGADLSENFDIAGKIKPGYVVCIDPRNPGRLMVSHRAYDRTVAGVISGANGVHPGMIMGQRGSEADGKHPVALTGRVYVWADAAGGAIGPGDLLTSSGTRGHAMKAGDYARIQGAVLGKAMTSLTRGKGLVLVLVSLQ